MGELMRLLLILTFVLSANGAFAHVGHIADVAGHGHWVGAAAIGLAILVGAYGKLKDREKAEPEAEEEAEAEEAPA